ncbi:hypothetical protein CE91St41_24570 [Oscillospiraceae bacterium]|nr:hypothetical protein CE91St40_12970 [Oscillospiraceae bacterium]BDF75568.1 hypothetical protein CE91St41_24570 [Oscillospiraceae bacterium]
MKSTLNYEKGVAARAAFLDFAIHAIGRELEAETTAPTLHLSGEVPDERFEIPNIPVNEESRKASLSAYNAITRPWYTVRLRTAVRQIFEHGFRQEEGYFTGTLYPEINLVAVSDGRHHLTAASMKGTASAKFWVTPLTPCFDTLRTDGAFWYFSEKQDAPVGEYRIAVLYELARQKQALNQSEAISEPPHGADTIEQPPEEPWDAAALLQFKNEEIFCLRQEVEILKRHVERLGGSSRGIDKPTGRTRE